MRRLAFLIALVFATAAFAGVSVNKRYRSALNPDRPVRKSTELIVLHTTEAPAKSSLRHTSERGLCHYCVVEDGTVYQIVDRHRVAFHAGCSMWNGKEEVDEFSVGIECVGYHNKAMPKKQLDAIRALVEELQKIYGIPDDRVVTHSQVAYGSPNKWHKCKHRGRKRCGMLFAMPSVRTYLKLKTRPLFDPDVRAKRLVVKDAYLNKMLYTSADTMVASYGKGSVKGVDPTKSRVGVKVDKGEKKENPKAQVKGKPQGIKGEINSRPPTKAFNKVPQTIADLNAQGYVVLGTISKKKMPLNIAGKDWKASDTYYLYKGKVTPGNLIDPKNVKEGMTIWRRKK